MLAAMASICADVNSSNLGIGLPRTYFRRQ